MKIAMMTKKRICIFQIMVYLLIAYCIFFPADKINIKELILIATLAVGYLGNTHNFKIPFFIFGYSILFPILTILYGLIRGVNLGSALSNGYVWIYLLLLPVIWNYGIDIKPVFFYATYMVALIIDFIMLADIVGIIPINTNPIALFFVEMNELQGLGKGILATFGYSIFYKSCPLILITYGYLISKQKYLWSAPLLLSMIACGTRANFLMVLVISIAVPLCCSEKTTKKLAILLVLVAFGVYCMPDIYDRMVALNKLKFNRSESIKFADAHYVINILCGNIFNFFLGMGVGSTFYSSRGRYMATFELSYVDFLRQVGIVGMLFFIKFIFKPIKRMNQNSKWLLVCYVSYLAVAFTNPLLVSSTSFMLFVLVYSECYKENCNISN